MHACIFQKVLTPWQGMKRSKSHEKTFVASRHIALLTKYDEQRSEETGEDGSHARSWAFALSKSRICQPVGTKEAKSIDFGDCVDFEN